MADVFLSMAEDECGVQAEKLAAELGKVIPKENAWPLCHAIQRVVGAKVSLAIKRERDHYRGIIRDLEAAHEAMGAMMRRQEARAVKAEERLRAAGLE